MKNFLLIEHIKISPYINGHGACHPNGNYLTVIIIRCDQHYYQVRNRSELRDSLVHHLFSRCLSIPNQQFLLESGLCLAIQSVHH